MPAGESKLVYKAVLLVINCWFNPEPSKVGIKDCSMLVNNNARPCCSNKVGLAFFRVDQ